MACIGTRNVNSPVVAKRLYDIGRKIVSDGKILVTGNAPGADQIFAEGGNDVDPRRVVLMLPWAHFEFGAIEPENQIFVPSPAEIERAGCLYDEIRGNTLFSRLTTGTQKLMARNVKIIAMADEVIAMPRRGSEGLPEGGTWFGMQLAHYNGIPLRDLSLEQIDPETKWDICPGCHRHQQDPAPDCTKLFHELKAYA